MPENAHECAFCERTGAPRRCEGCERAYYCDYVCQTHHWIYHIFSCNSGDVTTAHHLALAARHGDLPEPVTSAEYGISTAGSPHARIMLFGVYAGLLEGLGVKPVILHRWKEDGNLIENIKRAYEGVSEELRGDYYAWFLRNQHILSTEHVAVQEKEGLTVAQERAYRTWCFIGRPRDTPPQIVSSLVQSLPYNDGLCFELYTMLLRGVFPGPQFPIWMTFGFCACQGEEALTRLRSDYRALIAACTFEEFVRAFTNASLIRLFEEKGVTLCASPNIIDVLSGSPDRQKPVWPLKRYVECEYYNFKNKIIDSRTTKQLSIWGFSSVLPPEEQKMLVSLYKRFFGFETNGDPLQLDKARRAGRLYEFFTEDMLFILKPKKIYKRMLKVSKAPGSDLL
ncbi:hypothetical protein NP233_g5001 [Leucocoprinus birnbaumii]|uniref:MYND-type domain-containing protein n=1 Tax=Leucocoprinus birnbaumii TaxID=56174 RepID=A0AAD5YWS7_9AGAR|nr:hypothetical protein NP233_g5001 [Leucocoprinus birnbaumii]